MYRYANPEDGYAYTPIELSAIWAIPVDVDDVAESRVKVFDFHDHVGSDQDRNAQTLILSDTLAQYANPGQAFCPYCVMPWEGHRYSHAIGCDVTLCCGHVIQ